MSLIYQGFLTDADGSNPHSFRYGVPEGGSGYRCAGINDGWICERMIQLYIHYHDYYASYPDRVLPVFDDDTTLIFRYATLEESSNASYQTFLQYPCGNSAFPLPNGSTKVFWFCKDTLLIGNSNTRNILFYNNNGQFTFAFRLGTTIIFTVTNNYNYCIVAPWIYPNLRYNSNITGCAGSWSLLYRAEREPIRSILQLGNGEYMPNAVIPWSNDMDTWLNGLPEPVDVDNPYFNGGTSGTGGGGGNFSEDSDSVSEDEMPTLDAIGTGMATIFSPNKSQLKALSEVFWGSQWWTALQNTIEGIDKMFVSLGIVPFTVNKGATVEVTWLGLSITEVMLTLASKQMYEFDMGSINLGNDTRIFTSGSALDYSPFSKIGIYLPFIGYEELDIDEIRGATVSLKYRIDILSGTCVAIVKVNGNSIYQFTGNCITQIPITSQNFENLFTNAVNVGIALGTAKAGAAAANAGAEAATEKAASSEVGLAQHESIGAVAAAKVASAHSSLASATANTMMGMKPTFNKTGSISASASLFTVKQPFIFLVTPRQCLPSRYQRYCGFPSNMTGKLSEFSGFTVVEDIRLNGLVATSAEVGEIYDLLKSGVII